MARKVVGGRVWQVPVLTWIFSQETIATHWQNCQYLQGTFRGSAEQESRHFCHTLPTFHIIADSEVIQVGIVRISTGTRLPETDP
jgi:hypothetical protein